MQNNHFDTLNPKGRPFPTEPLIMALLLEQYKMINWLQKKIPIPKQRFFKCPPISKCKFQKLVVAI